MAHSSSFSHTDNYLTKTLMCKNNCGYYGNSIQYDGYCSICYRKLKSRSTKPTKHIDPNDVTSHSLLTTSQSFNNYFSHDERSEQTNRGTKTWNDHSNLGKFPDKRRPSNALSKFLRRPSSQSIVDKVSKVADKAVNIVDQSINENLPASLSSSFSIASINSYLNNNDTNLTDFNACLNKLVTSPSTTSTTSSAATFTNSNDSRQILTDFDQQFRLNFPQLYQDLFKQMRQFVDRFVERRNEPQLATSSKQNEVVQEFFKKIHKYVLGSASIRAYSERSQSQDLDTSEVGQDAEKLHEAVMIMVESYVTGSLYDYVFPAIMSEFEEQDMQLQKRIRDFYWVTNEMIGTCIDENSIFYRDSYEEALNYIVEMDSKHTAHEKMICITECSKNIYKAINISATISRDIDQFTNLSTNSSTAKSTPVKSVASADDYLPAFIYIVLKANPTMLYSNMNFISRFAFEKRILQGEHAYHFCSLNAIINHIEHLSAKHLNMSEEKFENYLNGLEENSTAVKLVQSNLKILADLGNKQKLLKQDTFRLQNEMDQFNRIMETKFYACLDKNKLAYTKNIAGYERKSVLDFELEKEASDLPVPLMPSSSSTTA